MEISTQKIVAILRKAGFDAAKWQASSMIRGWGDWSFGYKVHSNNGIYISHKQPHRMAQESAKVDIEKHLVEYQAALDNAGIVSEIQDGVLKVRGYKSEIKK